MPATADEPFATAAWETLGELRELTRDLPDDTRIEVVMRDAADPDEFYPGVLVEAGSSVDMSTDPPTIILTFPECTDVH